RSAVGQKITFSSCPQPLIALQQQRQRAADFSGTVQFSFGQKGAHPQRLPGQGSISIVINPGPFKTRPIDFQFGVVKKYFCPASISPPPVLCPSDHPLDKLPHQTPTSSNTFRSLLAQPFPQGRLV